MGEITTTPARPARPGKAVSRRSRMGTTPAAPGRPGTRRARPGSEPHRGQKLRYRFGNALPRGLVELGAADQVLVVESRVQ